jgi:chemotaxis protein histidine kinase CheA
LELDHAREEEIQTRNSFLLALLKAPPAIVRLTIADMVAFEGKLDAVVAADRKDLRALKSIVHTLKGNARAFGLKVIAERCHALESSLQAFPSLDDPSVKELVGRLRSDLLFFVQIYQQDLAPRHSEPSLIQRDKIGNTVIHFLKSDLENISSELAKPTPELVWNGDFASLNDEHSSMLLSVLGHLIRNSCDHGIEEVKERWERNKPPQGRITIQLSLDQDGYVLSYQDDGRGLHLEKMRQQHQAPGGDEQLALRIFESEFTTKDSVSSISGRGIGMMAVADELSSFRGGISIEFTAEEEGGFRPFRFLLKWPFGKAA